MLGLPDGQIHRECRSLSFAGAVGRHAAAVQLDEVPADREPQSEAAVRARRAAVRLAETLEHVGQEGRRDAVAGVGDIDPHVGTFGLHAHIDAPAARV